MNPETRETIVNASRPVRWAAAAALTVLALFLLVKTGDAMARYGKGENPQLNTITVTGTGDSAAVPDIATISFTVQQTAADVKTAQDAATKKTNDALAAIKALGVDDKDVKTTGYNVNPQYAVVQPCYPGSMCPQQGSSKITGYQVSQSIDVKVRDTSKAGDVLAKLGDLGVQNIYGPNFTTDDDSGVMNEARANAIADARAKAKELAKELGVSLGDVVNYSDGGGVMPYATKSSMAMDSAMGGSVAPTLPVGQDKRTVTVQVTYEIR
ncbi:MAG: SIMPL domain-containing protein [Candidatus Paceibacterota bacterium]